MKHKTDVIASKISDHYPIIHDGVFFWNIMMQCNIRGCGGSFNNGFGLIETDEAYIARLHRVADIIAASVRNNPSIEVIALCEGPIKPIHIDTLYTSLKKFPFMARFLTTIDFHKPNKPSQNWGLLMLADKRYAVSKVRCEFIEDNPKLANRFQLWKLVQDGLQKYIALAHFPFAGDEYKTESKHLSVSGQTYCRQINALMEGYRNDSLIFCADFNFNPHLISHGDDRALDEISPNNSILVTPNGSVTNVTVDGILLSIREKQKYQSTRPAPRLYSFKTLTHPFFTRKMKTDEQESSPILAFKSKR